MNDIVLARYEVAREGDKVWYSSDASTRSAYMSLMSTGPNAVTITAHLNVDGEGEIHAWRDDGSSLCNVTITSKETRK